MRGSGPQGGPEDNETISERRYHGLLLALMWFSMVYHKKFVS